MIKPYIALVPDRFLVF